MAKAEELSEGMWVEWNTRLGPTYGRVIEVVTSRTRAGRQEVAASADDER